MGYPASRRKRIKQQESELNITPIMNIFVLLIPFLLLTVVFAQTAIIGLSLPPSKKTTPSAALETPLKQLTLTINITDQGFRIGGTGAILPLIPMVVDGEYDFDALRAQLIIVRQHYPGEKDIIINSAPEVLYKDIISVMDIGLAMGFRDIALASAIK